MQTVIFVFFGHACRHFFTASHYTSPDINFSLRLNSYTKTGTSLQDCGCSFLKVQVIFLTPMILATPIEMNTAPKENRAPIFAAS
jgi:hypothetical protein